MNKMDKLFDLTGKVAVVTGSCGVLGNAMAKGLAERGVKVVISGLRQNVCDEKAKEIVDSGGIAIGIKADVTKKEDLEALREKAESELGPINILVNVAGGNVAAATVPPDGSFFDVPIEAVGGVMNINFLGTVLPCLVLGKAMSDRPGSCIINISSMTAEKATVTRVMGYSASKAAVTNFTRWLSVELARKHGENIRVNAISPGFFLGEQNKSLLTNEDGTLSARGQTIVDGTPFARFGQPEELVGPLVFLCSPASKFMTGTVLDVDGGFASFSGV